MGHGNQEKSNRVLLEMIPNFGVGWGVEMETKTEQVDHGDGEEWRIEARWDSKHGGKESAVRFSKTEEEAKRIVYGFKMKFKMGDL